MKDHGPTITSDGRKLQADQPIRIDLPLEHTSGWLPVEHSGFVFSDPDNIGRWICHEMHVKANTPGETDGAYTYWVDGEKLIEKTGVDLVGETDFHFNNAMLDSYWNDGSPTDQSRYYDNFVVSTQPIGCGR